MFDFNKYKKHFGLACAMACLVGCGNFPDTLVFTQEVSFTAQVGPRNKVKRPRSVTEILERRPEAEDQRTKIQVALLLDTSSSMNGLIEQAQTRLWDIVNELAHYTKNEEKLPLEIALYEYGNDGLAAEEGYIRQVSSLTTDLDVLSEKLFALRTNGGSEFCGWVAREVLEDLNWSSQEKSLKAIFVCGNEAFTQGPVAYEPVFKRANKEDIQISTIFCGPSESGGDWREAAIAGKGAFFSIQQDRKYIERPTPYDDDIRRCNSALNTTYIMSKTARVRQESADANAASSGGYFARSKTKASSAYRPKDDIVEQVESGVELDSIAEESLPEELQKMPRSQRAAYVAEQSEKRNALRTELLTLNKKRAEYLVENHEELPEEETLSTAINEFLSRLATAKGFHRQEK